MVKKLQLVFAEGSGEPAQNENGDLVFYDGDGDYVNIPMKFVFFKKPELLYQLENQPGVEFQLMMNGYTPTYTTYEKSCRLPWRSDHIIHLFALHAHYIQLVKDRKILNLKDMWKRITEDMLQEIHVDLRDDQAYNKWKVIKRAYKDVVDHNNKTGRDKKTYQYEKECFEAFQHDKDIHPEMVASQKGLQVVANKPLQEISFAKSDSSMSMEIHHNKNEITEDSEDATIESQNLAPNQQILKTPVNKKQSYSQSLEKIRETMETKAAIREENRKRMHDEKMEVDREKNRLRARKLDLLETQLKQKK